MMIMNILIDEELKRISLYPNPTIKCTNICFSTCYTLPSFFSKSFEFSHPPDAPLPAGCSFSTTSPCTPSPETATKPEFRFDFQWFFFARRWCQVWPNFMHQGPQDPWRRRTTRSYQRILARHRDHLHFRPFLLLTMGKLIMFHLSISFSGVLYSYYLPDFFPHPPRSLSSLWMKHP